jgi:hypothetical protein
VRYLQRQQHDWINNTSSTHRRSRVEPRFVTGGVPLSIGLVVAAVGGTLVLILGDFAQFGLIVALVGVALAAVSHITARGRSIEEAYRLGYDIAYEIGYERGYKRGGDDCWEGRIALTPQPEPKRQGA